MLALVGITAAGAAIRFATLGLQSFWSDEVFTSSDVSRPFGAMLDSVRTVESAPPLYFVVGWLWAKPFGSGEAGLRSLSALAGTLTIPVTYAAAAQLMSRRAGLLTAALAATSPFLVWYSQEARAYSLAVLLSSVGFLFFVRTAARSSRADVLGWAVFSILAVATHYMAGFVVLAEACALLLLGSRRREVLAGFATVVGVSLLLAGQNRNPPAWIVDIPRSYRAEETLRELVTASPMYPWAGTGSVAIDSHDLWWIAAVLLTAALASALAYGMPSEKRGVALAFAIGSAATLTPLLLGAVSDIVAEQGDYFLDRNVAFAWLPLAILVAGGIGVRRTGVVGVGAIAMLCAAGLAIVLTIDMDRSWQRDDWRLIARTLDVGSRAVIVVPGYQAAPLRYYGRGLGEASQPGARVREVDVVITRGMSREASAHVPAAFEAVATERIQRWEIHRFRSASPALVPAQPGLLVRQDAPR